MFRFLILMGVKFQSAAALTEKAVWPNKTAFPKGNDTISPRCTSGSAMISCSDVDKLVERRG